ncbi:MAG: MFS transporter [Candidatus Velthaea sp.]
MSLNGAILAARTARSLGYGAFTVVFAERLAALGFSPLGVGATISTALVAGAVSSAVTGTLVRTAGIARTFAASGLLMIVAAVLLAGNGSAVVAACILGVVSPGGQDVGPFAPIEQVALTARDASPARILARYNVAGAAALAVGALGAAVVPYGGVLVLYAAAGAVAIVVARILPDMPAATGETPKTRAPRYGTIERLAALFALDAFAGGFVVQAFLAYWFALRFHVGSETLGPLLFGANILAAASLLFAGRVAERFGLLNTMVFTHLPSNVLLCAIPFMPTLGLAAAVLLARFALSQMDVPTRQAYTLALVPPHDRARAAGITAAVRPAAAAFAPLLAGAALQFAEIGAPFLAAGGLKIAYDLALLATFRKHDGERRAGGDP